jgi:hypothetical protein
MDTAVVDPAADQDNRKAIAIFGLGSQQRSPFISTTKRINAVVEMTENGRQQAAIIGMPGLTSYITTGTRPARAFFIREGELTQYAVVDDIIYKLNANLAPEILGTFTTIEGPVWIADSGIELLFNDGVKAYIYNTMTLTFTQITDPSFPANARGGEFLQQRFWVYTTTGVEAGRVYGSDQLNGLSWDPLNFFTPEATPDGIVSITRWFNDLIVWGRTSIEWWTGNSVEIPGLLGFQPITGANTEVGLSGERAYGAVGQRLFFLGRVSGQAGIYEIVNYSAKKVSTPGVDADIVLRGNHTVSIGAGYMIGGHSIFQITFPGDSVQTAITWALDADSMLWCTRESYGKPYYRGLFVQSTLDRIFISDAFTGTFWEMSDASYSEGTDPLIFEVTSIHLLKEGDMLTVDNLQIDVETGLGLSVGQGSDPQGIIQISKDAGHTWGLERWVPLGKIGEYKRRAARRRIGSARGIAIRFRITDPIPRKVTGAYLIMTAGLS